MKRVAKLIHSPSIYVESHITGGCLFTELGFRVGFWLGFRVGFSSWIFELDFKLDFRVRIFWRFFFCGVSNKFSVVLHNVLRQWCCTSSRGLFKMEEKEDCRSVRAILFNLS